jgi:hypothetical protein
MRFIQVIEMVTTQPEEADRLLDAWRSQTEGRRTAQRGTLTKDRDRPDTYVQIVEFASYEDAMANSALPETGVFAERIAQLCDAPLAFRNLDVERVDEMG